MGKLLNDAIIFATTAHSEQKRKCTDIPYILHPLETAAIVASMTTDENVLAAAVLHDVVEDTNVSIEEIRELFGEKVATYVAYSSENKRGHLPASDTWRIRKEETLKHLKNAPIEVKMIAMGDKLSNIRSMYRDYLVQGDELWKRFNQKDKTQHHWYYMNIAFCLTELRLYPVFEEYCSLVKRTFELC